jgi:DNA invertase Pin-like site-specific DNA recombinase
MTQHRVQRIGYARVSSLDQNLARQLTTLGTVDHLIEEKQSGAQRAGRTGLAELIKYARNGDTVVVSSMDRLARSVVDLNQIVGELIAKGVTVEFIAERVAFTPGGRDPFAEFQLNIMASFAQLERSITRERQADGIKAAKARGVYQGRPRKLTADVLAEAKVLIAENVPRVEVARRLNIDRTTLYRALNRTESQ